MTSYQYFWLVTFGVIATLVIIDPNVGRYIIILTKEVRLNASRYWYMLRFRPIYLSSPLYKWLSMRKYIKIAEQIQSDYDKEKNKE